MVSIIAWGMKGGATEGEVIQSYRLDRLIAEGGMGAVWAATHTTLGRRAAVKLLASELAANRDYVSRFLSEARIVNDVRHPNIVDIFDFVEITEPPRVACIMELLEGPTLAQFIKAAPRSPTRAVQITLQLVDALVEVHAAGVVHRDLKPQNIIVVTPADGDFSAVPSVKILDFGIAKQGAAQANHKTATGSILGTPAYMAPEQVAATKVSGATDLYALAEILFEMVTGQRLYRGDNLAILRQKMSSEAPTLVVPDDVRDADRIVALLRPCLSPEPEARPGLSDFGDALRMLLDEWGEAVTHNEPAGRAPARRADTDTAATDPDPTRPDQVLTPPSLGDLPDEPAVNTQMFYDRILEDIDEAKPKYAPPPEPPPEPAPPEDIALGTPQSGHGYGVEGPKRGVIRTDLQVSEKQRATPPPVVAPGAIQVVQGQKVKRRPPWLLIGVVVVAALLLAAVAGLTLMPDMRNQARAQMDLLAESPGVKEAAARWQREFAPFTGSAKDFLQIAAKAHLEDSPDGYRRAREALRKALILAPDDPDALAAYIENEAVGFSDVLPPATRGELLGWLEGLVDGEGAARRAEAQLSLDPSRRKRLAQSLLQSPAAPDRVAGAALIAREEPDRALAAIEREGLPPRAVRVRAEALARQGDFRGALEGIATRRAREPDNRLLLGLEGRLLERVGDHRAAARRLAKAHAADPEHAATALAYGRVAAHQGQVAEAAQSLRAVAEDPKAKASLRAEAYVVWARLALSQTAWPIAEARAQAALELDPQHAGAGLLGAEALLQQGKPLAAQKILEAARAAHPEDPALAVLAAALALNRSQVTEATAAIEVARQADPSDPRMAAVASVLCSAAEDTARAEVHARHLLSLDPRFADHRDRTVEITQSTSQIVAEQLRRAPSPRGHAIEGVLHYLDGEAGPAQSSLRKAGAHPLALLYGAQLLLDRGATQRARRQIAKVPEEAAAAALVRARISARRGARVEAQADYGVARGTPALERAATVETAAVAKDEAALRSALTAHRDDPWLRARLYAR